jgi:hypothetical protein
MSYKGLGEMFLPLFFSPFSLAAKPETMIHHALFMAYASRGPNNGS